MTVFKCKMCGGTLNFAEGSTIAECESCGTKQTLPKLSDEKRANLYDRANHFRRNNDYDKALLIYEQILNEDKTDAEAYWSIVLCKYGIEYVEDPSTHKRIPTVNRTQFTSIFADEDYKAAIANADGYQRDLYEAEAKEIDKIQKGILAISGKESPYDVFICYKETDNGGRRTQDSVLAQDLYFGLKNEGFNVFFSRITLEDKLGSAYEPHIFAAIHSAKVMVVLGTKAEHFNAVWVKNEWRRYLALIKKGENKTLIPAYKDMDPYDLPDEFSHLQAQDMSKLGFMQDLIRGIKKIIGFSKPSKQETIIVKEAHDIAPLLRRAFLFLEDENFLSADEYAEKVLDQNPECAEAYVLKLLIELELTTLEQLKKYSSPISNNANYIKACRFADSKYRAVLEEYNAHILERLDTERKETIYREGLNLLNAKCYDDAIARFSKVLNYKDSADKIELCKQRKEIACKEQVYAQALHRVSVANSKDKILNYEEAIKRSIAELQSISGYKDSDERVAKLQAQLEKWRENKCVEEEQQKIEEQRQKKKEKTRFIAIIIVLIAVLAVLIPLISLSLAKDLEERNGLILAKEQDYYVVTGIAQFSENIVIPSSYKGKEVKAISAFAFDGETKMKSVEIPDSITDIGNYAFRSCASLMSVTFGEKSQLKIIGCGSFEDCNFLTEIALPKGLTSMDFRAFADCDSLTQIVIPSSVTNIGEGVFSSCKSLINIGVNEGSSFYKELDGNLYNKDGTELIQYATGKKNTSFYVPDSVIKIGGQAFYDCDFLKEIVISNGVKTIEGHAFYSCSALTKIVMPSSVTSIGSYAFYECTTALTIYCESFNAPYGWNTYWNPSGCSVVWNYKEKN